jgi:hypothetical protein
MRVLFSGRKRRLTLLGAVVTAGAVLMAPGTRGAATDNAAERNKRLMREQEPLVKAAILLQSEATKHPGYAGIVLNGTESVTLWWAGPLPRIMAAMVKEANNIAPVRVGQAKYSRAQLEAAAEKLLPLGPNSLFHSIKDVGTGAGLVLVAEPEMDGPGMREMLSKQIPDVGVDTQITFAPKLEPISRTDDSPPWRGGAQIINATIGAGCTSGFGVIARGRPAILTAGHCATANGQRIQDGSGEFIGNAAEKTNHDQMVVPTSSVSNEMYVGNRTSNTRKTVTAWEPCFIGELLCQSGVTTAGAIGSELCGIRVNSFNMDSESLVEGSQINGQQGARPGDSGGPLYSDRGATVIAKGTMTRVAGPNVGFQDIPTANTDFGGVVIPGGTQPTANVQLFQHCAFGGWQANFNNTGNVSTAQLQAAGGVNNDASSIRIAPGFRVVAFNGDGQTGTSVTLTGNVDCFVGVNFNDVLSSMRIEAIGGGGVVFFQHSNFGGASSQALAPGNYTLSALVALGFVNDWASSVRIPAGRTVTMFQHDNFTGTSWTLTADTPSFSALSPSANDQVSSVRVQ